MAPKYQWPSPKKLRRNFGATLTQVTGNAIPLICGENAGQHIYLDAGAYNENSASLSVVTTGTSDTRKWRILVSHIKCSSLMLPPQGCLQYHTGRLGSVKTFNYDTNGEYEHLQSQDYNVCIRYRNRIVHEEKK